MANKQIITGTIYGAASTTVEGVRHTKLWMGEHNTDPSNKDVKGIDLFSVKCSPEAFDSLAVSSFPSPIELEVELRRGAKNTMTQYCTGSRSVKKAS